MSEDILDISLRTVRTVCSFVHCLSIGDEFHVSEWKSTSHLPDCDSDEVDGVGDLIPRLHDNVTEIIGYTKIG